jgi:quercetin dioxygenase-like cupin family protein
MSENNIHEHAQALLKAAQATHAGRTAHLLIGGPDSTLTQTVIALRGGASLGEHENPGEASVLVLEGQVRLHADEDAWDGKVGDLLVVPHRRHGLDALTDSVVLLTAVKLGACEG